MSIDITRNASVKNAYIEYGGTVCVKKHTISLNRAERLADEGAAVELVLKCDHCGKTCETNGPISLLDSEGRDIGDTCESCEGSLSPVAGYVDGVEVRV